jgi:hypothetical protein
MRTTLGRTWIAKLLELVQETKFTLLNKSVSSTNWDANNSIIVQALLHKTPNSCQIYSQVELLSKRLIADGKDIRGATWQGQWQDIIKM